MIRRPVLVAFSGAVLVLSAARPAFAQQWLQRYLREHKPKANSSQTQGATNTDAPAATPSPTPADSTGEPEVRRALPVDPTETAAEVAPPPPRALPADAPDEPPSSAAQQSAPTAPPLTPFATATPMPVRRAEPVEPVPTPVSTPPRAEPVNTPIPVTPTRPPKVLLRPTPAPVASPEPSVVPPPPTTAAATPRQRPSVAATPVAAPTPAPDAPVLKAQTTAHASPVSTEAAPAEPVDQLDPNSSVIRLSPGAAPLPPDVNQFNIANDFYTKKDYGRAALEYERYLSMFPSGPSIEAATFRLAEAYRQMGNANAARKSYENLVFSFPDGDFTGPAAYRLADICFQEKSYSDALTFYRKASVRVKDPAIALSAKFNAARCLDSLNYNEDAIRGYQDILATKENNPFREASTFALARLEASVGRKTDAVALLDSLLKETTKDSVKAEATVRKGLLLLDLSQTDRAVAELNKALKMPELGEWKETAELGMLRIFYGQGKFQRVLDTYKTTDKEFSAIALPEVLLIVANSNRQLGKSDAARALYDQAIRDYPETVYAKEAQYERLITLYSSNSPDLIREVDTYLAQNPEAGSKRDQLTLLKAESLYKTKQYGPAAPLYQALGDSALAPSLKAEALFKLGWCYTQTRDNAAAVTAFSNFLSRYPAHKLAPAALAQRALSYQKANNFKAALSDFDSLLLRYPNTKEREFALQQKALILGQQEENQAMVDTFTRLLKEFPKSQAAGQANYWIGSTAMQSKNYKAAVAPLEAARKLDKDFSERATTLLLWAHYSLEERDAAAAEVDKAILPKAGTIKVPSEILHWLGMEFLTANDPKHAEKYLTLLTARSGQDEVSSDDWLNLGRARTKLSKWTEAEDAIQVYLKDASDPIPQATGYLALADAQLGASRLDEAQKSANRALELQPEGRLNSQARMTLGDILVQRADYDGAAKLYLSVSILGPEDPVLTPRSIEKAFNAYKKAGNETQAAKVLNDLQTKYPEYQLTPAGSATTSAIQQ